MLFNSLEYLLFLPLTVLIYHGLNNRYKAVFLLITSYIFYLWLHPLSPLVLIFTTLTGYILGIKIKDTFFDSKKRKLLFAGILVNIGILISFREIFQSVIPAIGVSFFTFQNISYLIDCYLEKVEPEKNFVYFSLYLAFFPKLLQGPIERVDKLIPQLKKLSNCEYEILRSGAQLFVWGMFKKVVIADNLALTVNNTLGDIEGSSNLALLLVAYFYAIQIYCDFSGYTDMAIGSAKLFGINLTNNFNYPYFAVSVQDFWRRWHITLSTWIMDYIFKPLQMNWRNYGNYGIIGSLVITFLACGIWHGLSWNYILWGLYHGILISLSFLTYKKWKKFCKKKKFNETMVYIFDVFVTFHLVCFGWIFFMTNNLIEIELIIKKIFNILLQFYSISIFSINFSIIKYFSMAILVLIIDLLQFKFNIKRICLEQKNVYVRFLIYYLLVMAIILFGKYGSSNLNSQFMYFQF